jgi:hypothetical protein
MRPFRTLPLALLLPTVAAACGGCRPAVWDGVFNAAFSQTLAWMLLPPAAIAALALGWDRFARFQKAYGTLQRASRRTAKETP